MSISASTLRKLALLSLSAEQMAGVLDILADAAEADEARKAGQRERTRRHRDVKRDGNVTDTLQARDNPSPKEKSPTPPKEITPSPVSEPIGSSTESAREFAEFWTLFPNKVGKRDAAKAFAGARRRAPFEAIMAGLRRYVGKTDDRPWCNPTTFLNQDRWEDMPASQPPRQSTSPPRKPNVVDAYHSIAREKGWISDEPEFVPSADDDAQRFSAVGGGPSGTVVDLRPGAFRRIRSSDL